MTKQHTTLLIDGIKWIVSGNERASYHYPERMVVIRYRHHIEHYVISSYGHDIHASKSASECLRFATDMLNTAEPILELVMIEDEVELTT